MDIEQDLIFIHVAEPGDVQYGTLFTSGNEGVIFSESLERHLFTHQAATDFYRVRGMRGVFLTSKVIKLRSIRLSVVKNKQARFAEKLYALTASLDSSGCWESVNIGFYGFSSIRF